MSDINETMIKVVELDQSTPLKVSLVDVILQISTRGTGKQHSNTESTIKDI